MKDSGKFWRNVILTGTLLIVIYKCLNSFGDIKAFATGFTQALLPCLLGLAIALFLYVPASKTEEWLHERGNKFIREKARGISVFALYLVIISISALGIICVVPVLYESIEELVSNIPAYTRAADRYFASNKYLAGISTGKLIDSGMENLLTFSKMTEYFDSLKGVFEAVKNVAGSLVSVFVSLVISVYLLLDRDSILSYLRRLRRRFLKDRYTKVTLYIKKTIKLFYSYFAGLGADALIVGIITSLGLLLLGVDYPLLIGVIIAVGNLVPVFGCIVSTVVSGILILVSGGFLQLVTMLLYVLTVYVADGYFIQPKIVGKSTGVRPVVALISVIIFGNLFGVVGMILGVPVAAALKMITDDCLNKENPM